MTTIAQLSADSSFESVVEATKTLLTQVQSDPPSATELQADIVHLLNLEKGPRGFFASFLTDSSSIADDPPETILNALKSVPNVTAEFLVKNLAMSTAMLVVHQRNNDAEATSGSQQVQTRSLDLMKRLDVDEITQELNAMILSLTSSDKYTEFLDRWNYDAEQRSSIGERVIFISKYRCLMFESR